MIRLQHYGLHTRLLDVTFNPLVALYFACQMSPNPDDNKDGIVYCGYEERSSNKVCMAIADYVFNFDAISINDRALGQVCQQYDIQKFDLESIYFLTPPLNNPRITMQNGAFIIAPLLRDKEEWPFNDANRTYINKGMRSAFKKEYTIPECSKTMILKELDYLGFNKATIYTDISNKLQYINEKENNDDWQIIDI